MARVNVFQGGNVQRQGLTNARQQGADYGPSALEAGLKTAGKAVGQFAEAQDQIEDINAKVEANRLAIEHADLTSQINRRVRETLGEGAEAAADLGVSDLKKQSDAILGRASPRAKMMLQNEIATRNIGATDNLYEHGFREKKAAFETSSLARIDKTVELANDEDDEGKAYQVFSSVIPIIEERGRFNGMGQDWVDAEKRKVASGFLKSRVVKIATDPTGQGGFKAAVDYATMHRGTLSDDDYNSIIGTYHDGALEEIALDYVEGRPDVESPTVALEKPANVDGTPQRRLDAQAFFEAFTVPHEGAAYVIDSNGAGVKYGINAAFNPGVDVKNLTKAGAAKIFTKNYFQKSGADKLPPALAAVHVDTFYLNEKEAGRILRASGNDVDRYVEMRHAFLNGLAAKNPAKFAKYQKGWANRTNALAAFADRQGGDGTPLNIEVAVNTSTESVRSRVMARTDMSLTLKKKIIGAFRDRKGELRQEREDRESETSRLLTSRAVELGDGFTDIRQLPQNLLLSASPSALATFTNMAKGNKESKPLSPELAAEIEFTQVADPRRFASQEFQDYIVKQGAPLSTVRAVAAEQGRIAGNLANPKSIDPIADGTLWTIAKPAFERSGIYLDSNEGGKTGSKGWERERATEDAQKGKAVGHLRDQMQRWMAANPGKKPSEDNIRGMVGWSLLEVNGKKRFEAGDQDIYMAIPQATRQRIISDLYGSGPRPPNAEIMRDVVSVRRNMEAARGRR